jgi:undecaprenyl-diphosphatase
VSSSAQLALLPWLLGWPSPADPTTFAAALHAGSCLGITATVREDLKRLSRKEILAVAVATIPAALAGYAGGELVERRLGGRLQMAALLAGAGLALVAADSRPQEHGVRPRDVAVAGLAQVVALAPGVSRSGATLTALRLAKVERASAQRFTLLMSVPVAAGAAGLTLLRADRDALRAMAPALCVGLPVSALTAAVCTAGQRRRGAVPVRAAALYRLGLAVVVAVRHVKEKS